MQNVLYFPNDPLMSFWFHLISHVPPINPTSCPYLRVTRRSVSWVTWEAVTGVEYTPCRGLLSHTLANGVLVYPSQGGRYRAEGTGLVIAVP